MLIYQLKRLNLTLCCTIIDVDKTFRYVLPILTLRQHKRWADFTGQESIVEVSKAGASG